MELIPIYMMKMLTQSFGLNLISQLNKQWQVCCFLLLSLGISSAYAQNPECLNTSSYGAALLDGTDALIQINSCNWEEEYSIVAGVVAGNTYEFTSSSSGYITIREGASDGPIIASGYSPVSATSNDGSNLYPHWNTDESCGTNDVCIVTTVQCTNCVEFLCPELLANPGDACDDLNENTINDILSEDCECVGEQFVFDIDCGSPLAQSFCYGNADRFWIYNAEPGVTLNLDFTAGTIETGWDFITIYDGADDLAPILFEGDPSFGEVSNINVNSSGSSILLVLDSDGLYSCADGAGYDTWEWTVSCGVSFDCPELEANIGASCDDGNENTLGDIVTEDCECIGIPVPENDGCDSAIALECGDSVEGTNIGATSDSFCNFTDRNAVWYSLTLEEAATISLTTCSSITDFDTDISIFTGDDCGSLTCFAGWGGDGYIDGPGNCSFQSWASLGEFDAEAGVTYYIAVAGYSNATGNFELSVECAFGVDCEELGLNIGDSCDDGDENTIDDVVSEDCECAGTPIPENDACDNAIALECGIPVVGTNIDATSDSFCNFTDRNAVWYSLTLDEAATISLTTCSSITDFDSDISIFTGDDCGSLTCFSGWGGAGYLDGPGTCDFQSWASLGEFDAEAGVTYYIAVAGYSNAEGNFELLAECSFGVDCEELGLNIGDSCDDGDENTIDDVVNEDCGCEGTPVPENDVCADAIAISCDEVISGTTIGASSEDQPYCGTSNGSAGAVWYAYTASGAGIATAGLCDADFDSKIRIFSGSCDALECVVGEDDDYTNCGGNDPIVDFEYEDGVTYYILVHGYSSNTGNFDLTLNCVPALDCPELEANIGDACDDGDDSTEDDVVTADCGCEGVSIFDCPELEANIGDACDDGDDSTEDDVVTADCGCEGTPIADPNACEDWVMYLNNNAGGVTDLYGVELVGGNAELSYLATIDYHAHIAYNPADNLVYVVSNSNASYVKVNPHVSPVEVSEVFYLAQNVPGVTTAVFGPDGDLLIGSATQDKIYSVNVSDNSLTVYDAYAPINGGDIAFDREGQLYLATRQGNGLYEVYPDGVWDDILIGSLSNQVTGMALSGDDQLILSHNGNSNLRVRDLDGSNPGDSYALILDGEAFDHNNGDMASGCNTFSDENEGDCDAFSTFYSHHVGGGADIYSVAYSGSDAVLSFLTNVPFTTHIAYNAEDDILYLVNPNGNFVRAYDPTLGTFLGDLPIIGGVNSIYSTVYNPADGQLYVGDTNDGEIYTIDLGTGQATYFADAPLHGGDLAIQDGKLYVANRGQGELYEITGGSAILVGDIPGANGMAQANNSTGLVLAYSGTSTFVEVSAADGSEVAVYTALVDGEALMLDNGDMAAGCGDDEEVIVPGGECYAVATVEYIEGTQSNGSALPADRADANNALGEPERVDALVFTTLGYGGSITVSFDGSVPNGEGDDIEVVETSYNNPGCAAYPEYATVEVSMDGVNWAVAGTVCKGDPYVDISDAGDYEYVMYVRVTNENDLSTSSDGFDVDGIVALHNCEESADGGEGVEDLVSVDSQNQLTSFPNPTNGPSQVVFVTAETGRTLVEVYDMNGRMVEALFNQEAQAGVEYRLDFNGNNLPNGVYIYRMTTENEVIVDKFMIAR